MDSEGETELFCRVCGRDYELPRRHVIKLGDHDFSPIPRLLACMHTLCHSCIEEQFEKDDKHIITCPKCQFEEPIFGPDFLPLDFNILKAVVNNNMANSFLTYCARCYDPVTACSWCTTCSSALCEFHHQDHKLSINTSKHSIATFKEYREHGKHIYFHFPPISCPECPMQDCCFYCSTCLQLVSAQSSILYHTNHQLIDYQDCLSDMKYTLQEVTTDATTSITTCQSLLTAMTNQLEAWKYEEKAYTEYVTKTFQELIISLQQRQEILLQRYQQQIQTQQSQLQLQYDALLTIQRKLQHVVKYNQELLQNTTNTPPTLPTPTTPLPPNDTRNLNTNPQSNEEESPRRYESMYLISSVDTIEYHTQRLLKQSQQLVDHYHQTYPTTSATHNSTAVTSISSRPAIVIMKEDVQVIQGIIRRLGAITSTTNDHSDQSTTHTSHHQHHHHHHSHGLSARLIEPEDSEGLSQLPLHLQHQKHEKQQQSTDDNHTTAADKNNERHQIDEYLQKLVSDYQLVFTVRVR
jgi:hypothetical protein